MEQTRILAWTQRLFEIGQVIAGEKPELVQQCLLDHLVQGFDASSGSIVLLDDKSETLTLVAGSGPAANFIGSSRPVGEGILGWVVKENKPLLLSGKITDDPRFKNLSVRPDADRPASAMCWPLEADNRLLGAVSINRDPAKPPFVESDLRDGRFMVALASLVVRNVDLYKQQQQRIIELHQLNQQLEDKQEQLKEEHLGRVASEQRLANILDIAPEAIIVVNQVREIIVYNKGAEQVFGYKTEEMIGQSLDRLLPERFAAAHRRHIEHFARSDRPFKSMHGRGDVVGRRRDGREFPAEASISYVKESGQQYFTVILRDISERKQAEDALRKEKEEQEALVKQLKEAQTQLLQSEKLASIGQLAAGVAHEINNPVGYITSNIGTLSQYLKDIFKILDAYEQAEPELADDDTRAALHALKEQVDLEYLKEDLQSLIAESEEGVRRVRQIVQDLKDFSHVDEAEWQWADLHQGIDSTLNIVHNEIKYKADVVKEYGDLPQVECIISQLNQVFMNLLVNAAHAMDEDSRGTITVRTGVGGDGVWVEIQDTGKGMDAETQKRIFDPFFTTKPVGKGTGLGLSLSYGIIQKHGGRIEVESEPGKGATFRIWLPVQQEEERAVG